MVFRIVELAPESIDFIAAAAQGPGHVECAVIGRGVLFHERRARPRLGEDLQHPVGPDEAKTRYADVHVTEGARVSNGRCHVEGAFVGVATAAVGRLVPALGTAPVAVDDVTVLALFAGVHVDESVAAAAQVALLFEADGARIGPAHPPVGGGLAWDAAAVYVAGLLAIAERAVIAQGVIG